MRGKELKSPKLRTKTGITPAYAGKSLAGLYDTPYVWDHPRLCGEKAKIVDQDFRIQGSPPPMRGKGAGR